MGKAKSRILSIATRSHLPSLSLCSVWSTHPLVFPSANKLPFKARDKKACGHSCEMATVSLQVGLRRKRSYLERIKPQLLGAGQQDAGDIRGPALSMKFPTSWEISFAVDHVNVFLLKESPSPYLPTSVTWTIAAASKQVLPSVHSSFYPKSLSFNLSSKMDAVLYHSSKEIKF